MAFSAARLRRWIALAGGLVCLVVAASYFYARHGVENALRQVPERLNIHVQQSAHGFTLSNSDQGRTLFKLEASRAIQLKAGGHTELHDVMITLYGRDSSRFDQIYGKTFDYDLASGDVTGKGEVSIDLQSNPQGASTPDQAAPLELKNPIHLKTSNLVFNQKTGDARTPSLVQFYVPEMSGTAVGAKYDASQGVLTLQSDVQMTVSGRTPLKIFAERAVLRKNPREIVLLRPKTDSAEEKGQADEATLFLRENNSLDHGIATGNVDIRTSPTREPAKEAAGEGKPVPANSEVTSQKLEVAMGARNQIETAVFTGDVQLTSEGKEQSQGWAGRAVVTFGQLNRVTRIRADEQAKWLEHGAATGKGGQDVEVTAPVIDMLVAEGNRLTRAETSGPPLIRLISPGGALPGEKQATETRVTADKFTAGFDSLGQLSRVHGEAHARVVATVPPEKQAPQPDRVTTSDSIDASFRPGTGIETLVQQGHFRYTSGTEQAFADRGRYTAADEILVLSGSPRVIDSGMETTANTVRLNRATGEGFAWGDVKTTYNDLKPQPNGALLASSDPVHVTAESMSTRNSPQIATYQGRARLWQNANMVEAPTIQFQKEARIVLADANSGEKVSTALTSVDKNGNVTPVHVNSDHLSYSDSERKAHYQGSVFAQSSDMKLTANQMDVYFLPGDQSTSPAAKPARAQVSSPAQAKLKKIIANGSVVFTQPNRRATGELLTYTSADDKFVMTGGPPSIFDAEHGTTTGVSLTLFRTDDRVIVDGSSRSPAVTETRVEH